MASGYVDFFELTKCNRTRANHDYKLYVKVTIINCYKYSFFIRIVNVWNNLPKDVVDAGSLTLFCDRLRIYMNINSVTIANTVVSMQMMFLILGLSFEIFFSVHDVLDSRFHTFSPLLWGIFYIRRDNF